MKHIRTTFAALLVVGAATAAVAQQGQPPAAGAHGTHGAQAGSRKGPGGRGDFGMRSNGALRGMTLSDAEKANLKAVREKYAPQMQAQMQAQREKFKQSHEAMRAAKERGDTAAFRALAKENATARREAMQQLATVQRADIRAALSAENQAKFDANVERMKTRMQQRPDSLRKHTRGTRPPA